MRTWGGRFAEDPDKDVADFTRSIEIDEALAFDDISGSIAHVRGLGRAGVLSEDEVHALVEGLVALAGDAAAGRLTWDPDLEDIHMNLEAALANKIGPLAGRLHTGRSRNDQVATDLRLWTRRAIDDLDARLVTFERALVRLAEQEGDAVLPGTTHIQPAQPVLFAHHLLAYVEMAERDRGRLGDSRRRLNVSPLGAGALAGAGYPLDRVATAAELEFDGVTANSLDAVSDRDFVVETLAAVALGMVHLSRLAEEVAWWSNPRFAFVGVADARRRTNISPLGAGALAGAGYPLDREATAAELDFDGVTANSLDAVSDRDFVVETLGAIALGMVHLSRLAEELTWWSNPSFGFVRASDAFSTGSSMMPNKKNPDPAELVRGRAARVIGELTGCLSMLKGLPLAYQRDLQESVAPLFDAVGVYSTSLRVMAGLVATLQVDAGRMATAASEGYTTATAVADALVRRGVPFRTAHHVVGSLVAQAESAGVLLDQVPDAMIGLALGAAGDDSVAAVAADPELGDALRGAASIDGALASCDVIGGTAPARVAVALRAARARLDEEPDAPD